MLLAVVWALAAPITAIGGSDVLVALGSGPLFCSLFGFVSFCLFFAWVHTHF